MSCPEGTHDTAVPLAQTCPDPLLPLREHRPGRNLPPSPVQSCRIKEGPREDALGGVKIPALSPEAEIMGRNCFCVVSASFPLAPLFPSTKPPLCEQF